MATTRAPLRYRTEGVPELQRALRKAGETEVPKALRRVNKDLAGQVAELADPPRRTGNLAQSLKALGGVRDATVKAGGTSRVEYAAVVHWGWPARGIQRNAFIYRALARARQNQAFEDAYLEAIQRVLEDHLGRH